MNAKSSLCKALMLVALFTALHAKACASDMSGLATDTFSLESVGGDNVTVKSAPARHSRIWHSLMPRRIVAQYAGGIGFVSVGVGWAYGKKRQFETDFLLGYVPPYSTGRGKLTITLKETYSPFDVRVFNNVDWSPLACGLYVGAITGHEFWMSEPVRYPHKYYGFSSSVRVGAFLGQRINLTIPRKRKTFVKEAMFYYEFGSCDLDISSFFANSSIHLWDIVNISLGVKLTVF